MFYNFRFIITKIYYENYKWGLGIGALGFGGFGVGGKPQTTKPKPTTPHPNTQHPKKKYFLLNKKKKN